MTAKLIIQTITLPRKTYKLIFKSKHDRDMVAHFLEDTSNYKIVSYES